MFGEFQEQILEEVRAAGLWLFYTHTHTHTHTPIHTTHSHYTHTRTHVLTHTHTTRKHTQNSKTTCFTVNICLGQYNSKFKLANYLLQVTRHEMKKYSRKQQRNEILPYSRFEPYVFMCFMVHLKCILLAPVYQELKQVLVTKRSIIKVLLLY